MNSHKLMLIVPSVVLVILAIWFFNRTAVVSTPVPKNDVIVAFGDSLVEGVGATEGHDFVSVLSAGVGKSIINLGKSGDTTAQAMQRLGDVTALDPGVVLVLLGGNDYVRRVPKASTFENLQTIVDTLKEKGSIVILPGVRGGLLKDTYEGDFDTFATKNNIPYVPNVLDGLIGNEKYMSDEIHPNDAGYEKVAAKVAPVLLRVLRK